MKSILGLTTTLCSLLAIPAFSGSFNAAHLPSDAKWTLHLDAEGLRQSALGKMMLEEMSKGDAERKFAALKAMARFDPRTDISSVTLCGVDEQEKNTLLMIKGTIDAEHLATLAAANDGYEALQHAGNVIHRWTEVKSGQKRTIHGAIHDGSTVLLSQSVDLMRASLNTLAGTGKSLAGDELVAGLNATSDRFVVAAADMSEMKAHAPQAALLQQARWAQFNLGQSGEDMTGALALNTGSKETAQQMQSMLQGMLAFAVLSQDRNPELARLASALTVRVDGEQLKAALAMPVEEIMTFMRKEMCKKHK